VWRRAISAARGGALLHLSSQRCCFNRGLLCGSVVQRQQQLRMLQCAVRWGVVGGGCAVATNRCVVAIRWRWCRPVLACQRGAAAAAHTECSCHHHVTLPAGMVGPRLFGVRARSCCGCAGVRRRRQHGRCCRATTSSRRGSGYLCHHPAAAAAAGSLAAAAACGTRPSRAPPRVPAVRCQTRCQQQDKRYSAALLPSAALQWTCCPALAALPRSRWSRCCTCSTPWSWAAACGSSRTARRGCPGGPAYR
jgi:hypothetical protein